MAVGFPTSRPTGFATSTQAPTASKVVAPVPTVASFAMASSAVGAVAGMCLSRFSMATPHVFGS